MAKTKYGKYIITKPKATIPQVSWGPSEIDTFNSSARVTFLDSDVIKGAFYLECAWRLKPTPDPNRPDVRSHKHSFDEVLAFYGSDPQNPWELGGEVELWLDDEKHILKKSFVVFIPKGLKHCPIIYRKVTRPIFHIAVGPASVYDGKKQ